MIKLLIEDADLLDITDTWSEDGQERPDREKPYYLFSDKQLQDFAEKGES